MSAGKLVAIGLVVMFAAGFGAPAPEPEPEPAAEQAPEPPQFAVSSTTAIRIGDELWLGSYRGDRLAYLPIPE